MKRLMVPVLVVFLSLTVLVGCGDDVLIGRLGVDLDKVAPEVIEGNSEFAFDIFRELNKEDSESNIFISPLSISTALTMTYQGAKGSTMEGMAEALNYKNIELSLVNDTYQNLLGYLVGVDKDIELNIANSVWIREGEEIRQDFLNVNQTVFRAEIAQLDFAKKDAAEKINQWIEKATKGKIEKMLDEEIPGNVIMYLIGAIYFKGEWAEQFDKENTFETDFLTGNGEKQPVMMMSRKGDIEYGEGDDYKAVKLPYGNEKTAMYVILPSADIEVNSFIDNMDRDKWEKIRGSISNRKDVLVQLPRFKIEYGIKLLNDSLSQLGMAEAFTDMADFSGIRDGIFINRVLHKAVIEVNEEGSEAAAATVVEMIEAAAIEPMTFIADRPFVFLIAEENTGTLLFMGKVNEVS